MAAFFASCLVLLAQVNHQYAVVMILKHVMINQGFYRLDSASLVFYGSGEGLSRMDAFDDEAVSVQILNVMGSREEL